MANEKIETNSKFYSYTDKVIKDEEGNVIDGDRLLDGMILRFTNGMLHSQGGPAVETKEGHMEFWKHGKLHREDGRPAVTTICPENTGEYREFWENGVRIK